MALVSGHSHSNPRMNRIILFFGGLLHTFDVLDLENTDSSMMKGHFVSGCRTAFFHYCSKATYRIAAKPWKAQKPIWGQKRIKKRVYG